MHVVPVTPGSVSGGFFLCAFAAIGGIEATQYGWAHGDWRIAAVGALLVLFFGAGAIGSVLTLFGIGGKR
jgi:hypothetical protein